MRKLALLLTVCMLLQCVVGVGALGEGDVVIPAEGAEVTEVTLPEEPVSNEEAEPVQAEPVQEEPVAEEPVVAEPVAEEPAVVEPAVEEPVVAEPVAEEPVVAEPVVEEPVVEEPVVAEPVVAEPVVEEPVVVEPIPEEPVVAEPAAEDEVIEEDSPLAELRKGAVLYEDAARTKEACRLAKEAVVLVAEEKDGFSKIQYVALNSEGAAEVKEGYAEQKDLTAMSPEEAEAWQAKNHADGKNVGGYTLEPVEAEAQKQDEAVPVIPVAPEAADDVVLDDLTVDGEGTKAYFGDAEAVANNADEWDLLTATEPGSMDFAVDASGTLIQYNGTATIVQIPLTVMRNGSPVTVTGIEDSAFAGNTSVQQIIIPTTVTWVDIGAFKGCTALTSINLPDSVTKINAEAFSGCTSLKSISWSDSVKEINDRAFYNCTSLQTLGSSSNVTKIGNYAFYGCGSLTAITWSNKLEEIGNYSYANCTGLTGLSFPATLKSVSDYAFSGCSNIQKLEFQGNATMKTIGAGAFKDCTALSGIFIPDSVTKIGNSAFENCRSASVLSLPANLKIIQDFTFKNCSSLRSLTIPSGVVDIHREAFYGCSSVEWVYTIPASVAFIGNYAFVGVKEGCYFVVENKDVVIGIDGLGTNGIVFADKGSTSEAYANSHANVTFYDIKILNYVRRCYDKILNRAGDPDGIFFWSLRLARHQDNGGQIVHSFVFSQEFKNRGLTDSQVVEILYEAMQDRSSDPSGKAFWEDCLNKGVSYDYIISGFCDSPEFHGVCNDYGIVPGPFTVSQNRDKNINTTAYVQRCYKEIQSRPGDEGGLNYWTGRLLNRTATGASIVAEFVASAEFQNRGLTNDEQVEILYKTMMNRASDAAGKAYWAAFLAHNMSIEYVIKGHSESVEFNFLCEGYGIAAGPFTPHEYRDWNANVTLYISRLYQYALNRTADIPGLNTRAGKILTKRATPADVAVEIFTSLECQLQWFTDAEFVNAVYWGMLNRAPSAAEKSAGTAVLAAGVSRGSFVATIGELPEFINMVAGFGIK